MNITEKDYNSSMFCVLDLGVPHPVEVFFHATGRDFTNVELCHEPTQIWEENEWRYALLYGKQNAIVHWISQCVSDTVYSDNRDSITASIVKCLQKCESRYGHSVSDYDEVGYDAKLLIK